MPTINIQEELKNAGPFLALRNTVSYEGFIQEDSVEGLLFLLLPSGALLSITESDVISVIDQPNYTKKNFPGQHVVVRVRKSALVTFMKVLESGKDPLPQASVSCSSDDGNTNCSCQKKCKTSATDCWCED